MMRCSNGEFLVVANKKERAGYFQNLWIHAFYSLVNSDIQQATPIQLHWVYLEMLVNSDI